MPKTFKSSGLSQAIVPKTSDKPKKMKLKNKNVKVPRGFRLSTKDQETLRDIAEHVAEQTNSKITDTHVLRALIHLGVNIEPEVILAKIREIII